MPRMSKVSERLTNVSLIILIATGTITLISLVLGWVRNGERQLEAWLAGKTAVVAEGIAKKVVSDSLNAHRQLSQRRRKGGRGDQR